MSGTYLQVGRCYYGMWRWWLVNSRGVAVHTNSYGYGSREAAVEAAHKSGLGFLG